MPANDDARMPPNDREAERSIIGSMLRDNSIIPETVTLIRGTSFYQHAHRLLFDAIVELVMVHNTAADPVTLADHLNEHGLIADIGGYGYIAELWDAAPAIANASHYATIVRGFAIKRAIAHIAHEIEAVAMQPGSDWSEVLSDAEKKIFGISQKCRSVQAVPFASVVTAAVDRIGKRIEEYESGVSPAGSIATGFEGLDRILGSVDNGDLVIIAARPSVGKTAFAMNMACRMAGNGSPVYVASLEQSREDIADRVIASYAGVDSSLIRRGKLDRYNQDKVLAAADNIKALPIWINDAPEQSMLDIIANMRRQKAANGCRAIFIDYLQLIQADDQRVNREQQIARMTRTLKIAARDVGLPVFLLAQVNREAEKGGDGRIKKHHLRESGAIEQDADIILLLQSQSDSDLALEVEIGKARKGKLGSAVIAFDKATLRMTDWEKAVAS